MLDFCKQGRLEHLFRTKRSGVYDRYATTPLAIFLEGATIAMGRLMPMISVVGIGASIILHRKEQLEPSFLTQSE